MVLPPKAIHPKGDTELSLKKREISAPLRLPIHLMEKSILNGSRKHKSLPWDSCRFIARIIALIYNWWPLFVRLAEPDKHYEAIVSRPLQLHGAGKQTSHAAQKTLTITSTQGRASYVRAAYERVCAFIGDCLAGYRNAL